MRVNHCDSSPGDQKLVVSMDTVIRRSNFKHAARNSNISDSVGTVVKRIACVCVNAVISGINADLSAAD